MKKKEKEDADEEAKKLKIAKEKVAERKRLIQMAKEDKLQKTLTNLTQAKVSVGQEASKGIFDRVVDKI